MFNVLPEMYRHLITMLCISKKKHIIDCETAEFIWFSAKNSLSSKHIKWAAY